MTEPVLVEESGPVTTLRLNRPARRNALDREALLLLDRLLREAGERTGTRVIVIAGDERAFSTGADLEEYLDFDAVAVRRNNEETWMRVFATIEELAEPVIASIGGYAVAGGTEMLLACDLAIAGAGASFGLTEARVGVIPGAGASVRLTRWVGRPIAKELLMLGGIIDAGEAHRIGLVNRLVEDRELVESTAAFAAELAARSPAALAAAKRSVNVGSELPLGEAIAYALDQFAALFGGFDQREGMSAFLEKRDPRFGGADD